ncbi:MAG: ATP-binding protein [Brevinematales bacterium]|nr:ATP-binding protein [Brevinematales bacterium]
MKVNVVNRVNNESLNKTDCLQPLFEAVINSIQAIEEADEKNGFVKVYIKREEGLYSDESNLMNINSFIIEDNGVGFTEINYESFLTSDSVKKSRIGGKGIGRFMWLKAFKKVNISSNYKHNGKYFNRSFDFILTDEGIENHKNEEVSLAKNITRISLIDYITTYKDYLPKGSDIIANKIIEHILIYFITNKCPRIEVIDMTTNEVFNLNKVFIEEINSESYNSRITFKEQEFNIAIYKLVVVERSEHKIFLCANERVVKFIQLQKCLPLLSSKFYESDDSSFYTLTYVTSSFLDETVKSNRTDFNINKSEDELNFNNINEKEIINEITKEIERQLEKYITPLKEKAYRKVQDYISDNPEYRFLLKKAEDKISKIALDTSEKILILNYMK